MADTTQLDVNFFDPAFRADPYPTYERLVVEQPVLETPFGEYAFSRHADCLAILRDAERFSSDVTRGKNFPAEQATGPLGETRSFLTLDPPDHTRLRGLVQKAFTPRMIERLRPRVQEIVGGILDRAEAQGGMEVVEDLAFPLPATVISELIGVPAGDIELFKEWSRPLGRALDPEIMLTPGEVAERDRSFENFVDYFRRMIVERKRTPGDDLLSALIAAEEEGDKLTEAELLSTLVLLLVAGHETTVNLIGNGVLALARHPDQHRRWHGDPSLDRPAVEEILRYDPPVQLDGRVAVEDVEMAGVVIEAGASPFLLLGAANRDPDVFERPGALDLTRPDNRHLSFGFGIHHCIGAPLARLEGQAALAGVAHRFSSVTIDNDTVEYKPNVVLRGLARLPVSLAV